jgi:hypothetical protein
MKTTYSIQIRVIDRMQYTIEADEESEETVIPRRVYYRANITGGPFVTDNQETPTDYRSFKVKVLESPVVWSYPVDDPFGEPIPGNPQALPLLEAIQQAIAAHEGELDFQNLESGFDGVPTGIEKQFTNQGNV